MYDNIDVSASLRKQYLVYIRKKSFSSSINTTFESITFLFIIIFPPFIAYIILRNNIEAQASFLLPLVFLIFYIPFSLVSLYHFLSPDRLKKVRGTDTSINRKISKEISEEFLWDIQKQHSKIIISKEYRNWYHWGRQFVIIYDQKDIFIKCITFGRYSMQSPLNWFGNWKTEKRFKKRFLEKIAEIKS